MKKSVLRFAFYLCLSAVICGCFSSVGYASQPSAENNVHFCLPLNHEAMRARDSIYAATKHALNLNVGAPRTVRMIYFLPNDRPFRQEVVDSMKVTIRQIQTFYADQMEARGHGRKTFRFETDARGEPIVHRVDGQYPDSHYLDNTSATVPDEIRGKFDTQANIYFMVIDNSINVIGTGDGRFAGGTGGILALVPGGFHWTTAAHELGHVFGLKHDFRDGNYIMSYGPRVEDQLSVCHAEFLSVHRYFNPDNFIISDTSFRELTEGTGGFFELMSSREYPAGSQSVSIQLKVRSSSGLHQVILFVKTRELHFAAGGLEVKACREFEGETDAIVQFDYDGVIPSDSGTSLSDPPIHEIFVRAIDTDGSIRGTFFSLIETSLPLIATLKGHTSFVRSVAFSPDGTILASSSENGTIKLWNMARKTNIATLRHTNLGYSIAFSPDGTILASSSENGTIKLWDVATRRNIATLGGHTSFVRSVAFSPDGTILASGALDDMVKLWDVAGQQHIATFKHPYFVESVAFSPDGTTLASGAWGGNSSADAGNIWLWDVSTRRNIATLSGHRGCVISVVFSPSGTLLASGASDETVKLWDIATRTNIATLEGHNSWVRSVAFSPGGTILASVPGFGDSTVRLWDVTTREHIATLEGYTALVNSVAFSPGGTILASGSDDGAVLLWDMSELGLAETSQDIFSLSLDGDGAAGDQAVTSLDVSPGSVVSIEVFGKDIQDAEGFSIRFEYDAEQVLYEGFDSGGVLPNAQVLSMPGTNPTAIEIWIASFGGRAAADSGLVGRIRFRTTSTFSGTTLRLMRAELGRGEERERITFDDTSVTLQLAALTPDFNGDGRVDLDDFLLFVEHLGFSRGDEGYDAKYDLDEDGVIGFGDFLIFANAFGKEG